MRRTGSYQNNFPGYRCSNLHWYSFPTRMVATGVCSLWDCLQRRCKPAIPTPHHVWMIHISSFLAICMIPPNTAASDSEPANDILPYKSSYKDVLSIAGKIALSCTPIYLRLTLVYCNIHIQPKVRLKGMPHIRYLLLAYREKTCMQTNQAYVSQYSLSANINLKLVVNDHLWLSTFTLITKF